MGGCRSFREFGDDEGFGGFVKLEDSRVEGQSGGAGGESDFGGDSERQADLEPLIVDWVEFAWLVVCVWFVIWRAKGCALAEVSEMAFLYCR